MQHKELSKVMGRRKLICYLVDAFQSTQEYRVCVLPRKGSRETLSKVRTFALEISFFHSVLVDVRPQNGLKSEKKPHNCLHQGPLHSARIFKNVVFCF